MVVEVSRREAEVLAALGERLSDAQIAGRMHISVRTVESHIWSLLRKYGVADRWALAEEARRGTPPPGHIAGLPSARTAFFGRADETALVLGLLGDARLVTLVGAGGIGKTRLAAGPPGGPRRRSRWAARSSTSCPRAARSSRRPSPPRSG